MRPSVPPLRPLSAIVLAWLAASSLAIAPVLANDEVSGTPDVTITIGGSGLSDASVRLQPGAIVRFQNRDDDRHRMRSTSGPGEFDTGNLEPGESALVRLGAAGTYRYVDERDDDDADYHGRFVVEAAGASDGGGSSGGGGSTGGGGSSGGGSTGGSGSTTPSTATVDIGDDFYAPASVRITVGGTVTWRNTGGDDHSATSSGGGGIDSGTLTGGESYRRTFASAGTYAFLCIFHSDMRGTVEVVAGSGEAVPPAAPAPTPSPPPTTPPAPTTGGDGSAGGAPTSVEVEIGDLFFRPAAVRVVAGGPIVFTNIGEAPHTATADDGSFDSGILAAGAAFTTSIATPGSYPFFCAVHPDMRGTLEVVADTSANGGGGGAGAPTASATPSSSAAPSVEPTPGASAWASAAAVVAASTQPDATPDTAAAAAASTGAAGAGGVGSLGGLAAAVTLVSIAVALFAKVLGGTVRQPR